MSFSFSGPVSPYPKDEGVAAAPCCEGTSCCSRWSTALSFLGCCALICSAVVLLAGLPDWSSPEGVSQILYKC